MPNCKTIFKIPMGKIETKNQMSCRVTSFLWLTNCPPVIVPTRDAATVCLMEACQWMCDPGVYH